MVPIKQQIANAANYGSKRDLSKISLFIGIHGTGNDGDTDESNANYFKNRIVKASAHYFVADDSITLSVPDNFIAFAVGGKKYNNSGGRLYGTVKNANTINIELCDTIKNGIVYPSEKTIQNALELVQMLMKKYNIPAHRVIRHYDVNGKPCPSYWVDDNKWKNEFWNKIGNTRPTSGQDVNPYKEPTKNITSDAIAKTKKLTSYESKGEGVKWVQWELCQLSATNKELIYAHGGIDGICGKTTTELIKNAQRNYGLSPVDGICGKNTRNAFKAD